MLWICSKFYAELVRQPRDAHHVAIHPLTWTSCMHNPVELGSILVSGDDDDHHDGLVQKTEGRETVIYLASSRGCYIPFKQFSFISK